MTTFWDQSQEEKDNEEEELTTRWWDKEQCDRQLKREPIPKR